MEGKSDPFPPLTGSLFSLVQRTSAAAVLLDSAVHQWERSEYIKMFGYMVGCGYVFAGTLQQGLSLLPPLPPNSAADSFSFWSPIRHFCLPESPPEWGAALLVTGSLIVLDSLPWPRLRSVPNKWRPFALWECILGSQLVISGIDLISRSRWMLLDRFSGPILALGILSDAGRTWWLQHSSTEGGRLERWKNRSKILLGVTISLAFMVDALVGTNIWSQTMGSLWQACQVQVT